MSHIACIALLIGVVWLVTPLFASAPAVGATSFWVYIGTSSGKPHQGIYLGQLDVATATLKSVALAAESPNPSFLALHPNGRFLYAVAESGGGKIRAFAINPSDGALTFLNEQPSGGNGPTHLEIDAGGRNALTANYGAGSVAVLPIQADGKLSPASCVIQHHGSSIDPKRQTKPYAHSINLDPSQRFAIACDLGCDKLFVYRFDADAGKLTPNDPPSADIKPGSGPRHMAFSSDGKFAYVINEMGSSITAFRYDADRGVLKEIQMISTLPKGFTAENTGAEIMLHPSGKFLYASNRGQNSIAIFEVDQLTGKLLADGSQSTQGKTPRFFCIDPTGQVIIAQNQNSDSMLLLKIDPDTGHLIPGQEIANVPAPTCAVFLKK